MKDEVRAGASDLTEDGARTRMGVFHTSSFNL